MRAVPTPAGFKHLRALRKYANANTKKPKMYKKKRCNLCTVSEIKDELFPPSEFALLDDIHVDIHPDKEIALIISII